MPKSKPFIDRSTARQFHLVHRSRRDPLFGGGDGEDDKVLKEVGARRGETRNELERRLGLTGEEDVDDYDDGEDFYDDDYDYMQHLRTVGEDQRGGINETTVLLEAPSRKVSAAKTSPRGLVLPKEVLPSEQELDYAQVIARDQATFDPDLDPRIREVLEALEDDAYVENEPMKEDDDGDRDGDDEESFWEGLLLSGQDGVESRTERHSQRIKDGDEERSETSSLESPPKTDYSGFSMSSSAMHRNPQLTTLDDKFDRLDALYEDEEEDENEEDHLGTSEREELQPLNAEQIDSIYDEFLDKYEIVGRRMRPILGGQSSVSKLEALRKELGQVSIREQKDEPREPLEDRVSEVKDDQWDVETIMTTYSNLENRPKKILVNGGGPLIRIHPRTGMPITRVRQSRLTIDPPRQDDAIEEADSESGGSASHSAPALPGTKGAQTVARERGETPEEKRARKAAQKTNQRERRSVKRETKEMFRLEKKKQSQAKGPRQEIVSLS